MGCAEAHPKDRGEMARRPGEREGAGPIFERGTCPAGSNLVSYTRLLCRRCRILGMFRSLPL